VSADRQPSTTDLWGPPHDPRTFELGAEEDVGGDVAHAARLLAACAAGRCLYAIPTPRQEERECVGYLGVVRREAGIGVVVRYTQCPRHRGVVRGMELGRLLVAARMPSALLARSFATFRPSLGTAAALAAMTRALDDPGGVILAGPPRVGKTHLAAALVNAKLARRQAATFVSTAGLMADLRRASGAKGGDPEAVLEAVILAPCLVLDDLGVERPTEFVLESLYRVVEARLHGERQTIATTNFQTPELLSGRLGGTAGARIVARLLECCAWVTIASSLTPLPGPAGEA